MDRLLCGIGAGLWVAVMAPAPATGIAIDPSDDAALYTCSGCNTVSSQSYLLVAGYIQGALKFPTAAITEPIAQALLAVNPYGLPLHDLTVDVYGYTSDHGTITAADAHAGDFLGTWVLSSNLGFGEDAFFDVTSVLASTSAPYVAFNLRSDTGTDVFSSLEINYDHPAQLRVTFVPEPSTGMLLAAGLASVALARRRQYAA